jgi:hypothetical protein
VKNDPLEEFDELSVLLSAFPHIHEPADNLNIADLIMSIAVDPVGRCQHVRFHVFVAVKVHGQSVNSA